MKTVTQIKPRSTTYVVDAATIILIGWFLAYVALGAAGWL